MRILVISHSHGRRGSLEYLLKNEDYDRVIFLGDYCADFQSVPIAYSFPPIVVKGRYDKYHTKPEFVRTKIGGCSFHVVNGFTLGNTLPDLMDYAKGRDIDVVVYSSTPNDSIIRDRRCLFVNPGYFGVEHDGKRTYAIITIESGELCAEIKECYVD